MKPQDQDSPFGDVIYAYTRSQAVADGVQVEVTKSRPQKIHPPLPFSFNQVLAAVGSGAGTNKPAPPIKSQVSKAEKPKKSK